MYVGLIVRDECERSVKTQASKDEQVDFVIGSRVATREKSHMYSTWLEDEESSRLYFLRVSRR